MAVSQSYTILERLKKNSEATEETGSAGGKKSRQLLADAHALVEGGQLQAAGELLESVDYASLSDKDALVARTMALQLAVLQERFTDALFHADAALDINDEEALIYHLTGRALWGSGREEAGAESLVKAAEMVASAVETSFLLPFESLPVFFMAGEACFHLNHNEAAKMFYNLALEQAPGSDFILNMISQVEAALANE